jgi:hypothetical protein
VPWQWRLALKGWPGLNARCLVKLAGNIAAKREPERFHHPHAEFDRPRRPVRHPHDDRVWLGGVAAFRNLPKGVDLPKCVDVAVSLCRVHDEDIRGGIIHLDVRLIDKAEENANLDYVLLDTVRAVEQLRSDGHVVYLHCEQDLSRTPAVAALYGARRRRIGLDEALDDLRAVLPEVEPNPDLLAALHRLHPASRRAER